MKILFVTNLCPPYRVGIFELLAKEYDIEFLFFSSQGEKYYDGKLCLGNFRGRYLGGFFILPKIKINPELISKLTFCDYSHAIISFWGSFPLLLSFIIARLRRKKIILWAWSWHHPNSLSYKLAFPLIKYAYQECNSIVAYGTHVKSFLISMGIDERKIFIAPQAQDNIKFDKTITPEEKLKLKQQLGIHKQRVILFVGRLVEEKGIHVLLDAFKGLEHKDLSLIFVGKGCLEGFIKACMVSDKRIIHRPYVQNEQLCVYYAIADIFVLPSVTTAKHKEPWGISVNEAMCQGCAVVVSDAVGAAMGGLIKNNENGLVVKEGDVSALTNAMRVLLNNHIVFESIRRNARESVKDWNYVNMVKGFEEALSFAGK